VIVVSDSSPLITLARIGKLSLLSSLYERILIPALLLFRLCGEAALYY
jgi:predicted nucleic acid-binding protein